MTSRPSICVMGSFIVDLMMRAPRLPLPGETIKGRVFKIGPGGKGSNQAVAARRAGAETTIITKIGKDQFTSLAIESFKKEGLATDLVFMDENAATGAALIMVDEKSGQNSIVVTLGACGNLTAGEIDKAREKIARAGVFLTQLETNLEVVEHAISIAHASGVPVILNPAPADTVPDAILAKVDYLTPNESEASALCGFPIESIEDMQKAGKMLLAKGVKNVIFTIGKKGAYLYNDQVQRAFPPYDVQVVDTTGAGDAFNGGLAVAIAEKKPLEQAIQFANAVASLKVTRVGTAPGMPTRDEIDKLLER
ncbi:MAG: ribokinase [Candidatus Sigynarchaeota archaeon]